MAGWVWSGTGSHLPLSSGGCGAGPGGFLEGGPHPDRQYAGWVAFLQGRDPAEYAAIVWFREDAAPGRIVEAVGDDYSDYGRISSSTGRPTVLAGQDMSTNGGAAPSFSKVGLMTWRRFTRVTTRRGWRSFWTGTIFGTFTWECGSLIATATGTWRSLAEC